MREKIARFGDGQRLVGILSEPTAEAADRPAVIIVNAGIVHRVGPNRLHVRLARRLAQAGFVVLRFDLSGLGDSAPREDGLPYHRSRVGETVEAMDHVAALRGIDRFVILGLCSGADHAFRVACADPRVAGAAMIDGYAYASAEFERTQQSKRRAQALRRVLTPDLWWRLVTGRHPVWKLAGKAILRVLGSPGNAGSGDVERFVIDLPPKALAVERTEELRSRGVHLLFIYTARLSKMYRAQADAADAYPRTDSAGVVRVSCLDGADHTFTLLSHQQRLIAVVRSWAKDVWQVAAQQSVS